MAESDWEASLLESTQLLRPSINPLKWTLTLNALIRTAADNKPSRKTEIELSHRYEGGTIVNCAGPALSVAAHERSTAVKSCFP